MQLQPPYDDDPDEPQPHPIEDAVDWAAKLRTIAERLAGRPNREHAARTVARIAQTVERAVELHRTGDLDEPSTACLDELLDRLDESTWTGRESQTKNDILRQASFGTFPPAADQLARSMTAQSRERTADRARTFRPEPGAIDLSGLDDQR